MRAKKTYFNKPPVLIAAAAASPDYIVSIRIGKNCIKEIMDK